MKLGPLFASRSMRSALLGSVLVGWAVAISGVVGERGFVVAAGVTIVAISNVILTKVLLELRSSLRAVAGMHLQVTATGEALREMSEDFDALRSQRDEMMLRADSQERRLSELRTGADSLEERLADSNDRQSDGAARSDAIARAVEELRVQLSGLAAAHETTRTGLLALRTMTDRLAHRARDRSLDSRLESVAATDVESPLLSIAIPSFNRPGQLAELLEGIAAEMATCPAGSVEVCITDDASPDPETLEIALDFAERHPFGSLRRHPANVGLERNVMAACEPCRGEFVLLVGNDDRLVPGALTAILDDIRTSGASLLLYAKRRMNLDGSHRADIPGSIPVDLPVGHSHVFESVADAAREQGLLSTFGFIGPIVRRRIPFLEVDPAPYFDLTMYAQVWVTIEAFAREPVFYRNMATVVHRTPTPSQKHAEALSRPEEEFMRGGNSRLARYFGTSLAAALQRLVDRGALDHDTIAVLPEHLMSNLSLVDWIAHNRGIDPDMEERLGPSVSSDADRFFAALAAMSDPAGGR